MSRHAVSAALLACGVALSLASAPAFSDSADRSKPIHLEADRVSIDDARQVSTFTGHVRLTQGTLSITGDQLVVVQDKQGIERGTATGQPAAFRQKRDGADEYVEGFGDTIEYDVVADVVNIYGQARIKRGQDDVRGEHIVYYPRTQVFQVSGAAAASPSQERKVRVVIQPKPPGAASAAPPTEPLKIKPDVTLPQPGDKP